jgi:hypothetical protein
MKNPLTAYPDLPATTLALTSLAVGCSATDQALQSISIKLGVTESQQKAFLQETLFFYHFLAIASLFSLFADSAQLREYCDRMVVATDRVSELGRMEKFGLPALTYLDDGVITEAIKYCFHSFAKITSVARQRLYLGREPSESEFQIMHSSIVSQITGWHSDSANLTQYFVAAYIARLALSVGIDTNTSPLETMTLCE